MAENSRSGAFGRKLVAFLSGGQTGPVVAEAEEEEAPRGFWGYLRHRWKEPEAQEGGFFRRFRNVYGNYQQKKSAEAEKFRTYEAIEAASRLSAEFLVLLIGACLIATFGLFQNSTAVIIGAMLIAPLMMPLFGFSLGAVWGDRKLLWRSVVVLVLATTICMTIAALLTIAVPGVEFNSELLARTNPNLFDIIVALASGFIGAYAYVNPNISNSVSGVAIAVALMPPLCTIGISLGLQDIRAAIGAALLYMTNLVGISLAASVVFWRFRVHPSGQEAEEVNERAKRNVLFSTFMLLLIAAPLGYFMVEAFALRKSQGALQQLLSRKYPRAEVLNLEVKKFRDNTVIHGAIALPDAKNGGKTADPEQVEADIRGLFTGKTEVNIIFLGNLKKEEPVSNTENPAEEKGKRQPVKIPALH